MNINIIRKQCIVILQNCIILIFRYEKYNFFINCNSYVFSYDKEMTKKCFDNIRNNGNYLYTIGPYIIDNIRDLTIGYDSSTADFKPVLPVSSSSEMITYINCL